MTKSTWHAFSQIVPPPPINKTICFDNQRMVAELFTPANIFEDIFNT
jgi:hypothetical protein